MNDQKHTKRIPNKKKTNSKSKTALKKSRRLELPHLEGLSPDSVKNKLVLEHIRVMFQNLTQYNCLNSFLTHPDVMITYESWKEYCRNDPYVRAAHRMLKQCIATKRIEAAMKKECDPKLISEFQITLYSHHDKEHYKWTVELREKLIRDLKELMEDNNRAQQPIYIQIDGEEYTISEGR